MRHRRALVGAFLAAAAVVTAASSLLVPRFSTAGYTDETSDSARAAAILKNQLHAPAFDMAVLVTAGTDVSDETAAGPARKLLAELAGQPRIQSVLSYWSGLPELKSRDGHSALILVGVDPSSANPELYRTLVSRYQGNIFDGLRLAVTGPGVVGNAVSDAVMADLSRTEIIVLPVTLLLLVWVFGSVVSALMPLVIGVTSIVITSALLGLLSRVADVSVFSLNLTTGLGLGLGIDYALLLVSRFREERAKGLDPPEAAAVMLGTAGRTVLFSGLTVAVTLGALLFFPLVFLRSLAFAGILVVGAALVSALVLLPPLLVLLGRRLETGSMRASGFGFWRRISALVAKAPLPIASATLAVLVLLALPVRGLVLGMIDERALPAGTPSAQASADIAASFDGSVTSPLEILLPAAVSDEQALTLCGRIDGLPHVAAAVPLPAEDGWLRLQVLTQTGPRTPETAGLTAAVRALVHEVSPAGLVGGAGAEYVDAMRGLGDHVLAAALWVAASMFCLFFLFTGSIILPIKALILNVLSLSATLGVLTWVFIGGQTWLVGPFTVVGSMDASIVALTVVVVFALSMDYEVFILLRIKEESETAATRPAVAEGLRRSAFIITVAAGLLALVFVGFVFSGVTTIKMLGAGVTVALLLDATLVRVLLMPATMILAGRWNWWALKPLRTWYERYGFHE